MNDEVFALAVFNNELIAGGVFTSAGGTPVKNIARWNGLSWQSLGEGLGFSVLALSVIDGDLIAGGGFQTVGGLNKIALWNGTTWQPLGIGMNDSVWALSTFNNELIAGGQFTTAGGTPASHIARWDGASWQPLGIGLDTNGYAQALTPFNGELLVGGNFTTAGGEVSAYFARWGPDCPRGDMNCDQAIDLADVPLFVDALLIAPELSTCDAYLANANADVNLDGTPVVNGLDAQAFVDCLVSGLCP